MLPKTIQLALESGRADEAETICRQTLAEHPDCAEAHNILGVLLRNRGRSADAVNAHRSALSYQQDVSQFHNNLGVALTDAGLLDQATHAFRNALKFSPDDPEVHSNLGVVLMQLGRLDEATPILLRAVALQPDSLASQYNLGNVLHATGRFDEAILTYAAAIRIKPDCGEAWCNMGVSLRTKGDLPQSIAAYNRAMELLPRSADVRMNLGVALAAMGRTEEAIEAYECAIILDPQFAAAHYNLGNALREQDKPQEAVSAYREAIRLNPSFAAAHCNLGNALLALGEHGEAMSAYNAAVERAPQSADAHWNRALMRLLLGDYEEGWKEFEWRNRLEPPSSEVFPQPQWTGEDLAGRTILLHAEQGLGDTIQFVRYVPLVAARGGRVILRCQPQLIELLQGLKGVDMLMAQDRPLPAFDVHCSLMSLPRALCTGLCTIPNEMPYLAPDPMRTQAWEAILGPGKGRHRVGLVWAGRPQHQYDHHRSMALSTLAPLAGASVDFVSLQKGDASAQANHPPPGMQLIDHTALLHDYADTAALISHLDLVIAVDTSVAHLAAAMGKPVWLLLAYAPDWRWLLDRHDSPWYPTMRLFRQWTLGDWGSVIEQVAQMLSTT